MTTTTLSPNGIATPVVVMPRELTFHVGAANVTIDQGTITVKGHETNSGVTYKGSRKGIVLRLPDGNTPAAPTRANPTPPEVDRILESLTANLEGAILSLGEPHTSAQYRYPAKDRKGNTHPKAGQTKADSGGMRSVRAFFIGMVHGQLSTVFLTLTRVIEGGEQITTPSGEKVYVDGEDKGFTLSAKVMPRSTASASAEVEGFETF